MNPTTHQSISVAVNQALAEAPAAKEDRSIDSPDFCMDDFRMERNLAPVKMLGSMLAKLKGKRIESVEWVQTYRMSDLSHKGFFRIKVS